ncbi:MULTISPECIES: TSUP family transporter [Pseudoalteromonas]|uniref:Probable membrane transporter protein n=1 Tax=Pseudoalteromonas ruthenica TaxID=151081 RepID=A0A0F4PL52_9GAMM|nr:MULTISPECIES: TSUP family transporter [Pseudoalteromonas]KJY96265.1 membrane protein [Pseudoalteromonas ruthenica]KJY96368.1 membrane protein [Pseudoalteromonas ruthenica]MCF2861255.1 TSUP family transporter [Pseudoalteromonas sp. CNAT2-18]MCG7557706.1 TSUP family transporter [Pseudoalteromonas sp. CNAT2-18.1]MCG7565303.1 TSUP family transporter [Pseudoalteromonas sp. CnMc7-15]|tara:strand:- start:17763 stop:18539 length:777 start_codon:yes stop_codon:yes gene_type:complete
MFELALDPSTWAILCAVALAAGFIDAIAGGGGMLTVPALLTAGLPPHLTLGTNKLAASFGSLTASVTYYRKRLFDPKFWAASILATAIGATLGTLLVDSMSTEFLNKLIPVVIIAVAIYSLFGKLSPQQSNDLPLLSGAMRIKQWLQGLALGFFDGMAGPGTGTFWTASNSLLYKMSLLINCGLARSMNFVSNFISLITFVALGHVNFLLGATMGLFLMLGAWLGAHSAIRFGSKMIRPVFNTVVIVLALKLVYEAYL